MNSTVDGNSGGWDHIHVHLFVKPGLCGKSGTDNIFFKSSYCSLSSEGCKEGFYFSSSQNKNNIKRHSGTCEISSNSTDGVKIGQCEDEFSGLSPCASVKELCSDPASFNKFSKNCDVVNDNTSETTKKTKYGSCTSRGVKTCFWSFGTWCDDDDPSMFKLDDSCTCENVLLGACKSKNDGKKFCAVSERSCDNSSTWIAPHDFMTRHFTKCHLCGELRENPHHMPSVDYPSADIPLAPAYRPTLLSPSSLSVFAPILSPSEDLASPPTFDHLQESGNASNDSGLVIGNVIGGIILTAILIISLIICVHRQNQQRIIARMTAGTIELSITGLDVLSPNNIRNRNQAEKEII